jgi:hypothetical protein
MKLIPKIYIVKHEGYVLFNVSFDDLDCNPNTEKCWVVRCNDVVLNNRGEWEFAPHDPNSQLNNFFPRTVHTFKEAKMLLEKYIKGNDL